MPRTSSRVWRWTAAVSMAALLFASVPAAAGAGPAGSAGSAGAPGQIALSAVNQPMRLMVQLASDPLADDPPSPGATAARQTDLMAEHAGFRLALSSAGIAYKQVGEYTKLFNGVTIQVSSGDAGRIAGMRGVKAVFVSRQTELPKPMDASSLKMINADKAQAGDLSQHIPGVDGSGITVAVIDTGIDYTHPDLGGCLGPNCRVVWGYDFVGEKFMKRPHPFG